MRDSFAFHYLFHVKNLLPMLLCVSACVTSQETSKGESTTLKGAAASYEVVLASDVNWEPLNPARGDQSPMAADLWGDRKEHGATGYLLRPVDGFRSPPHVHNVSYRAVVIRGLLHNDAPSATELWMPTGSFWTQPKGAVHITAAKGTDTLAYIEIDEGPYLVYPTAKAFASTEQPINIHASKIDWVSPKTASPAGFQISHLWGNANDQTPNGTFVRLPTGFEGTVQSQGSSLRAVVIQGSPKHRTLSEAVGRRLTPGSYFSSMGNAQHHISSGNEQCIIYVRTTGRFEIVPAQHSK